MRLPINQVLVGDCVEVMKTLPAESIDTTMFSPPYWGLRDYGVEGQIGLESTYEMYIAKMVEVCREVKRVLKKTGSMYLVLGDTYAASRSYQVPHTKWKVAESSIVKKSRKATLPSKCLVGVPWRVALSLVDDGWILRNDIIWHKPNAMPSSVKDRLSNTHEHIFHLVKARRYYYDLDAIREPHKTDKCWGQAHQKGSSSPVALDKRGYIGGGPSLHQKSHHSKGKNPGDIFQTRKEPYIGNNPHRMRLQKEQYLALDPSRPMDLSHPLGKNPGDFWSISTKPFKGAHFAVYPEEICVRPIKSSCPPDGVVLDPMCGSGTTLVVAKKLGRRWVGIDINPDYVEMTKARLSAVPERLTKFLCEWIKEEEEIK